MNQRRFFIAALVVMVLFPTLAQAGDLKDFEDAASRQSSQRNRDQEDNKETCDGSLVGCLFSEVIGSAFQVVFVQSAQLSLARVKGASVGDDLRIEPRTRGGPDLPSVSGGVNYQWLNSDIWAVDGRGEVGYGPGAVEIRETHFQERGGRERLDLWYARGLFRVSGSSVFQFNAGLGPVFLKGRRSHSGVSTTLGVLVRPVSCLALGFTPSWSWVGDDPIRDYDTNLSYVRPFFSLRLGYRTTRAGSESLHGPYVGAAFHY